MASPLRPDPPEHHRPSHAADFARGDSLDRPVGRLPGPHQRWGTRRANPLAGLAPTGGCGWDVALVASGFLCVYLWGMIRSRGGAGGGGGGGGERFPGAPPYHTGAWPGPSAVTVDER